MLITSLLLAVATLHQGADTTLTVRKGQRLEVSVYAGSITVTTWNRDAIRVQGDTRRKDHLDINADGSTISVETSGKWGPAGNADIEITMPAWMAIELSGVETDLTVDGLQVHGAWRNGAGRRHRQGRRGQRLGAIGRGRGDRHRRERPGRGPVGQ